MDNMQDNIMRDNDMQENNNIVSNANITLLGAMEHIVVASKGCHLYPIFYQLNPDIKDELECLTSRLEISEEDAIIFSILCEFSAQKAVSLYDIGRHLYCDNLEILQHKQAVDRLIGRGFVIEEPNDCYFVPKEILKALSRDNVWQDEVPVHNCDIDLCQDIYRRLTLASAYRISKLTTHKNVLQLLEVNASLHIAAAMKDYQTRLDEDEFMFLIAMICKWLVNGSDKISFSITSKVLRDDNYIRKVRSKLLVGTSPLLTEGIIKSFFDDNINGRLGCTLTDSTMQKLCPEGMLTPGPTNNINMIGDGFDTLEEVETNNSTIITPDRIVKRQLYYNPATARQVKELATLLDEKKMTKVLHRLKSSGLRCGFACLFHGGPGTGKTETVLQLARQTGRAVFQVEVSQLRSKWHGESERIVKGVFDDYRRAAAQADKAPIMLFNEADAIFTRRMENAERTIDKSENAIQNIILQEIENLDGILIATTNLQGNLDPAFERRFLYKIEFETPDAETRAKIWHSMMPSVKIADAQALAKQFPDLAGGHIENIARKTAVAHVLHGRRTSWDELTEMCRQELLNSRKHNTIGFKPLSNQ